MANSAYKINKGINVAIEFRGLKAQYIWWLGGGMVALLILFAILYMAGIDSYLCVGLILPLGTVFVAWVFRLSNRYGEHGMMKKMARRSVPQTVTARNRRLFCAL
ncbi:MAG TPA: DUF4133 domain-containing protein [Puia sp.]|nr:DUF4133 domain-containing protein [Puia sp.]